jgi:hypothetical protein
MVQFTTSTPNLLLSTFKKAIDEGRVDTWFYDKDGDFTHSPVQWRGLAWLRPKVQMGKLTLHIIKPQNQEISSEVYAVYHGRFIESMVRHCDKLFSECNATAMPTGDDLV